MRSFVLFNNKGGVGKTALIFHLAHTIARLGKRVVALDYDPQANLTSMLIREDELFETYSDPAARNNVAGSLDLVRRGKGDVIDPELTEIANNLWLVPGHLSLSRFEQTVAGEWDKKAGPSNERALDVLMALDMLSNKAAEKVDADYAIVDVGPSLDALNRSALLACDAVVFPLAPDLFSLQGLMNVGPSLREWRSEWELVRERYMKGRAQAALPRHDFRPLGYILQQHLARADRPVAAYARWAQQIPESYRKHILEESCSVPVDIANDSNCIGTIKHVAGLVPIAQQARKPMFDLKQADGIGAGQIQSVFQCRKLFEEIAGKILDRLG